MNLSTKTKLLLLNLLMFLMALAIIADSIINIDNRSMLSRCLVAIPRVVFIVIIIYTKRKIKQSNQ